MPVPAGRQRERAPVVGGLDRAVQRLQQRRAQLGLRLDAGHATDRDAVDAHSLGDALALGLVIRVRPSDDTERKQRQNGGEDDQALTHMAAQW